MDKSRCSDFVKPSENGGGVVETNATAFFSLGTVKSKMERKIQPTVKNQGRSMILANRSRPAEVGGREETVETRLELAMPRVEAR